MPSEDDIDTVEALSRLARDDGKDCTVGKDGGSCLTTPNALKLIREWYAAGATLVLTHIVR